jgi:predicted HicB family RNase H-like nuclease
LGEVVKTRYKGFVAKIFFSPDAGIFCGEILNSKDLIVFQAAGPLEIIELMHEAIDDYLANQKFKTLAECEEA